MPPKSTNRPTLKPELVTKVYDLRGTHGSGKSSVVHRLLKRFGNVPIEKQNGEVIGHYMPDIDCCVVGKYESACGGCDAIKSQEEVIARLTFFRSNPEVYGYRLILEGILVAHTYERYAKLADEIGRENYTFMFLDTPLETCIERVRKRRIRQGNHKGYLPENLTKDHQVIQVRLPQRFKDAGYQTTIIDHRDPVFDVLITMGLFKEAEAL